MRLDVTLQRQSIFIIGIVVVGITSFFVAFALAVGGLSVLSPYGNQMHGAGLDAESNARSNDILEPIFGNTNLVPVAKEYCVGPFDTEPGEIKLIDYYFPFINEDGTLKELPLCITNEMAQEWWWEVSVTGGYTPLDTSDFWPWMGITVWQDQNKDGFPEMIQGWNLEWEYIGKDPQCDCCSCHIWIASPGWCGNKVCLDSNQYPVLSGGLENGYNFVKPEGQDKIPGKDVYIHFGLLWEGCELEEQQFAYILAQERLYTPLKSPTPDLEQCSVVSCPR